MAASMRKGQQPDHPLQCRCGTVKGHLSRPGMATHIVCYCADCQAYARYLGQADKVLDERGGTTILATLPSQVHFDEGAGALACMSLSETGLLRWYAGCCNTPIGNTPRGFKMPYVGLVATCLANESPSLQESFGPARIVMGAKSALGPVKGSGPGTTLKAMARLMTPVLGARLSGDYKRNPFFDTTAGAPVVQPRVLTEAERARFA